MINFEQLTVYQKAVDFASIVYTFTKDWPKAELFDITSQFRRASISISLNIAEGSSRSKKDFAHFLTISRGSCYECIALLTIALKIQLIKQQEYQDFNSKLQELCKMTSALRNAILK